MLSFRRGTRRNLFKEQISPIVPMTDSFFLSFRRGTRRNLKVNKQISHLRNSGLGEAPRGQNQQSVIGSEVEG